MAPHAIRLDAFFLDTECLFLLKFKGLDRKVSMP